VNSTASFIAFNNVAQESGAKTVPQCKKDNAIPSQAQLQNGQ